MVGVDLIQKGGNGTVRNVFNVRDLPAETKVIPIKVQVVEILSDIDRLVCLYLTKTASKVVSILFNCAAEGKSIRIFLSVVTYKWLLP